MNSEDTAYLLELSEHIGSNALDLARNALDYNGDDRERAIKALRALLKKYVDASLARSDLIKFLNCSSKGEIPAFTDDTPDMAAHLSTMLEEHNGNVSAVREEIERQMKMLDTGAKDLMGAISWIRTQMPDIDEEDPSDWEAMQNQEENEA
ncbi:hypothetical protein [Leptolyngbya sp. FACHB-17]|uniref:hypothetical protein n=1 Tax=unclassified Leptolyngbya TaxID=2650499 RepID=UPI0016819F10|nr:hypothetical protein [Leptolyngbya sp. FACHB-17]MBD2079585.1 hypothetical protein [Leptolyngbya sp. FACHB-17]